MKRKCIIPIISLSIIITGCKIATTPSDDANFMFIPKDKIVTIDKITFDDSRFIDSCVFIPLETTDASLIGNINQIEFCDGKFYIFDGKEDKLKVFSSTGKFLFDIGIRGEAPGEYLSINSFFINREDKKVGISDPLRMAIHEYSLDGEYIQTVKHNQEPLLSLNKSICIDGYIYSYFDVSHINDMTYSVLSAKDYSIIDRWSPYPVKVNQQMACVLLSHPFSVVDGDLHFVELYSDTIFTYHNGEKQPYLLIETGLPAITPSYFEGKPFEFDPVQAFFAVSSDKKYSSGFKEYFETDRYILTSFSYSDNFYVIDKDNMETFHIKKRDNCLDIMKSILVSENKLVGVYNQDDISYIQSLIEDDKDLYPSHVQEFMSNYDLDNDNPILIVYYLKKSV